MPALEVLALGCLAPKMWSHRTVQLLPRRVGPMQPIASPQQQANPLLLGVSLSGNDSLGEAVLQFWVKGRRAIASIMPLGWHR